LARQTSKLHETDHEHERVSNVFGFARDLTTSTQADVEKEGCRMSEEGTFGEVEEQPKEPEEVHEAAYEDYELRKWIENRVAAEDSRGIPRKRMGLSWRDLRVVAPGRRSAVFIKTLPRAILGTFGIDLAYFAKEIFQGLLKRNTKLKFDRYEADYWGTRGCFEAWGDIACAWPSGVEVFDAPTSRHALLAQLTHTGSRFQRLVWWFNSR
jgi:hypothetical protein